MNPTPHLKGLHVATLSRFSGLRQEQYELCIVVVYSTGDYRRVYVYVYGVQEFLIFTLSRSRVLNGGNQGKVKWRIEIQV